LAGLLDPKYALVEHYAQHYTTFTSEEAEKYIKRARRDTCPMTDVFLLAGPSEPILASK
jgi:hypothetical protein